VPTVLDSFVIAFSLDPSQFTRGQQQVLDDVRKLEDQAHRSAVETESSTKKLGELFSGMKREMLGFVGLAVGGYEARKFFDYLVNLDATTSRLSRTLGINVRELSAWQNAAKTVGGTGQEITGTIMRLEQEVYNFRFGVGSNLPGQLRALGVLDVFDANRNPKSGVELLRDITSAVDRLPMPTAGKSAFLRVIGLDETTINLVIRGRAELEKTLAAMRQAGGTTEESGRAAEEFQKKEGALETAFINLGRAIAGPFLGPLTWVADKLTTILGLVTKLEQTQVGSMLFKAGMNALIPGSGLLISGPTGSGADPMVAARARLAEGLGHPSAGSGGNWTNFLSALSYLETSQKGGGNTGSSAEGYFQFLAGTAAKARGAGINDPRSGSYGDQASETQKYIQQFYPDAAAAIQRGDFPAAIASLNKEWPSLPGGSQPQSAARYATFEAELHGGGPRPPGMQVTVENMTVNSRADNAAGIATDIKVELTGSSFAAQVPQGLQ
jgi:hypothetical protein